MCIKDYIFRENEEPTFGKGKVYLSENDEELTASNGGKWPFGNAKDYFRPATEDEIPHKPKFKDGDWITNGEYTWLIEGMHNSFYDIVSSEGCKTDDTISHVDEHFHPWTIQDAKDGDVLANEYNTIFIYAGIDATCQFRGSSNAIIYHAVFGCRGFIGERGTGVGNVKETYFPATKEQRDLLFQKMHEVGYEWDADKKELKKIVKRWRDDEDVQLKGYFLENENIYKTDTHPLFKGLMNNGVFATEVQAKSALAMARISQIMANDERFGGVVTDKEWESGCDFYVLDVSLCNEVVTSVSNEYKRFLAFHLLEQRDLFWKENRDLVEDYLMIPKKGE